MLPVVWLAEAESELQEAVAWYAKISPQLAERFASAVVFTVEAIAKSPLHSVVVRHGTRRSGVHRFPHGIFFRVEQQRILVVACFHPKRNPRRWRGLG